MATAGAGEPQWVTVTAAREVAEEVYTHLHAQNEETRVAQQRMYEEQVNQWQQQQQHMVKLQAIAEKFREVDSNINSAEAAFNQIKVDIDEVVSGAQVKFDELTGHCQVEFQRIQEQVDQVKAVTASVQTAESTKYAFEAGKLSADL